MSEDRTTREVYVPLAKIQLNTRLLPLLVGLLFVLQILLPYRGWIVLLVGLGGGWALSFLWARSLAAGLRLVREMRFGWAQVGDHLQERFTLINAGWAAALWVELVDHSDLPGYTVGRVTGLGGTDTTRWRTHGVCMHRGVFTIGPTSLRTGDPFGLYSVTLYYPQSTALMVLPPIVPLPTIEIAPGGRAGEGQRSRPDPFERTVGAAGVRDYQPGDNLSWIHWPISAHRDALYVRLFDSMPTSDWWIFLDLDQAVQCGQGWDSTEEHGVMLAASLADQGLRVGRSVGLVAHGQELVWLPPGGRSRGGAGKRLEILRALASVAPGTTPLDELFRGQVGRSVFRHRPSLVVITPAVAGQWVEALLNLMWQGAVPTVLLLDPRSFGDPGADDPAALLGVLSDFGVARYLITRDMMDRVEARPGQEGQWEWRVLPTGHVVPLRQPRDMTWKRLA